MPVPNNPIVVTSCFKESNKASAYLKVVLTPLMVFWYGVDSQLQALHVQRVDRYAALHRFAAEDDSARLGRRQRRQTFLC